MDSCLDLVKLLWILTDFIVCMNTHVDMCNFGSDHDRQLKTAPDMKTP